MTRCVLCGSAAGVRLADRKVGEDAGGRRHLPVAFYRREPRCVRHRAGNRAGKSR